MDILDVISGRARGLLPSLCRGGLLLLVPFYAGAILIRNQAFNRGWFREVRLPRPVISVGNLTTGGTGKTPTVAWIARWLLDHGRQPVLLSRGYRSLDGHENDEKRLLASLVPGLPHHQGRDRVSLGRQAVESGLGEILLLDDGFQHRRLARDLDLVLVDALQPWGYGQLLPRGLLREPRSALQRADLILVTRCDLVSPVELDSLRREMTRETSAPHLLTYFAPSRLINRQGTTADLTTCRGIPCAAFCGVGHPEAFRRTLEECGFELEGRFRTFPDHHHYNVADFAELQNCVRASGAVVVLTTRKDLVKIDLQSFTDVALWALDVDLCFLEGQLLLEEALLRTISPNDRGVGNPSLTG